MAQFLTTKAIAFQIEEIVKSAKEKIYIVTPYLKLSNTFYERLYEASEKGIDITLVYGKNELSKHDEELIHSLDINIYFKENLHAKCYLNEEFTLITSMNLHSFSEGNNREFGILLNKQEDENAYNDCFNEVKSVIATSKTERRIESNPNEKTNEYIDFLFEWGKHLKKRFPKIKFEIKNNKIFAESFPKEGIMFSNEYGFMTFTFSNSFPKLSVKRRDSIESSLESYRVFWNKRSNDSHRICIYKAKDIKFDTIDDEIKYSANGLNIFLEEIESYL